MRIETIRHSLSHIMAYAVQELYPGTKFGIGPAIENGFYYDFDLKRSLAPEDLPKIAESKVSSLTLASLQVIEEKIRGLIKQNIKFEKKIISKKEAKKIFKNQPYKLELIEEKSKIKNQKSKTQIKNQKLSIYQCGNFMDLCVGPHVKSTQEINPDAFKLTKIAGAYWRGSEKNVMLTRIYGLAFQTKKELADYLKLEKEAEKRDHRLLGKKLDLFNISEQVGSGLVIFHPKGAIIRHLIEDFWKKEHQKRGYQYVYSPHIGNLNLWKTSGHWEFYRENLYNPIGIDEEQYLLKPMNCPFHVQIYKSQIRSYRDLPLRYCELGAVYRYEKAGVLHGLLRVRGFTQDDAHIFCAGDQITEEVKGVLDLALFMLAFFGFKKYEVDLSVRDLKNKSKYLGDNKIWQKAENALEYVLKKKKIKYKRAEGEAVFYGPKIDIKLIDAIGRPWQGPTIQVDFNFPEKFDLTYIDNKGKKREVVMIHRTVLGSMERFIGVLLEHYAGALPLWLSPEQVWIIPVGSGHKKYAQKVKKELSSFRVEVRSENETVSKKIREGEIQKIPYLLVVGNKEVKEKSVGVRKRGKGDIGMMKIDKFIEKIKIETKQKK